MKYSQKALKTYKMYRYLKKQTIMFMKRMTYTTKFMSAFAIVTLYNPQNEAFRLFRTNRIIS